MKGRLIVIEGLDGSGKATQTSLLCNYLKLKNKNVLSVHFPDYNEPSSSLVKMYLNFEFGHDPNIVNAYAASTFYAIDRYASFLKFWKDKYNSGYNVIADRYTTSNIVYQMHKLKFQKWDSYLNWLYDFEYIKLELPKPDLVIYLDMPVEFSQNLMNVRYLGHEEKKDLHESNITFLEKCRKSALYSSEKYNWNKIECFYKDQIKSIDEIHNEILSVIKKAGF